MSGYDAAFGAEIERELEKMKRQRHVPVVQRAEPASRVPTSEIDAAVKRAAADARAIDAAKRRLG